MKIFRIEAAIGHQPSRVWDPKMASLDDDQSSDRRCCITRFTCTASDQACPARSVWVKGKSIPVFFHQADDAQA